MAAKLPPYIAWRNGRPRFIPDATLRALGFAGQDIREAGGWATFEQASAWGWKRYRDVLKARGYSDEQAGALAIAKQQGKTLKLEPAGKASRRIAAAIARSDTVEDLLEDFIDAMRKGAPGPKGHPLSADAITSYRKSADAIIFQPEERGSAKDRRRKEAAAELLGVNRPARPKELFATTPARAIGKVELHDFFLYARDERGHHMALSMVAVFSAAWTWGQLTPRWRLGANPRHDIKFPRPEGRIVVYDADELAAMIAAADAMGRASIGDAVLLGVDTGQRQRDRLLLSDNGLMDGRRHFRQSKTGMVVQIKETRRLAQRLAEARARVNAIKLRLGTRPETIVVDETTGLPYEQSTYRHVYAAVRARAWQGSNEHRLPPCPGLRFVDPRSGEEDFKTDQDLRDTCVTRLYRAGCGPLEICDITGHSYAMVQTIIKHYLARDPVRADAAIAKLEAWMDREAVNGQGS